MSEKQVSGKKNRPPSALDGFKIAFSVIFWGLYSVSNFRDLQRSSTYKTHSKFERVIFFD